MTGGGIERVLRSLSAALTGCPSIRRSVKTDRHERFSAQRKRSVFSECRPLQRSGGGRAARVALQTPLGLRSPLRSIAPIWPLRLSPPLERQDASGDESLDASLQQAGGGYRRSSAAQARFREATDGPMWPSHPSLTTAPASQPLPLARSSDAINHMTITEEETAMNTVISTSEYASVGTDTGLTVPTPATAPTTMKGAAKSQRQAPTRIGRAQLQAIAERLDTTDRALLALLAAHRYATTRQLAQITELSGQYGSARSALRQTSRRLRRQHGLGLVAHLARRIGGTRAGSAGYVWYLTAAGQRLGDEGRGARRRFQEPSPLFLAHTLAITQARVVIEQAIHAVGGHLARLRTEPACWRSWLRLGGALGWLKPDLEAITATDTGAEDHWLLEVDLDTEHPARLLAKCHDYQAHLASGTFQAQHGYYPQVVWLLTNQARAGRLAEQIAADQTLTPGLFKITAAPEQLAALIQRGP